MANFIVRVELIDIIGDSFLLYSRLHDAMNEAGFNKTMRFQSRPSDLYELPDGEYFIKMDSTVANIRDYAKTTVEPIWTNFRLLVSEADDVVAYNLRKISE